MNQILPPYMARVRASQLGMPIDSDFYCTENFQWQELLKNQLELPSLEVFDNLKKVCMVLQIYRDKVFKSPITITSGYRSPAYNRKIGGASQSYHTKGMALDFKVKGFTDEEVYKLMDKLHYGGVEKTSGGWCHIDIGTHRRFDYQGNILANNYDTVAHDKIFKGG